MSAGRSAQWIALWVTPLAPNNFCGDDASFSQEFDDLKTEILKDSSLHGTSSTDWAIVLRMASDFLSTKSKNLWVFAYAIYAYIKVNGLEESTNIFKVFTEIIETHWDSIYPLPERIQRRMAPIQWLSIKLELITKSIELKINDIENINKLRVECQKLQNLLQNKVSDNATIFAAFLNNLDTATTKQAINETKHLINSIPDSKSSEQITTIISDLEPEERIPPEILPQLQRNLIAQNRQLAAHFLAANLLDERAYQLHRTALWSTLLQLPQSDQNGKTQLTCGVPTDKIYLYSSSLANKRYIEILPQLERSASKAPFWFEGHYMVAQCLEGLGGTAALSSIHNGLAQLLERFPELLKFTFKCGTPFAPDKIYSWLENIPKKHATAPLQINLSTEYKELKKFNDDEYRMQEAIKLNNSQNFKAGLLHIGDSPKGKCRDAIYHALTQAKYCIATGKKKTAANLLQAIYNKLYQWNLLDWEPSLTTNIISLLILTNDKRLDIPEDMIHCLYLLDTETAVNIFPEKQSTR